MLVANIPFTAPLNHDEAKETKGVRGYDVIIQVMLYWMLLFKYDSLRSIGC